MVAPHLHQFHSPWNYEDQKHIFFTQSAPCTNVSQLTGIQHQNCSYVPLSFLQYGFRGSPSPALRNIQFSLTVDPSDHHTLPKGLPQQCRATCWVVVEELKDIHAPLVEGAWFWDEHDTTSFLKICLPTCVTRVYVNRGGRAARHPPPPWCVSP